MFSILRSSLNNASYTQYRRSAINVYKNTFKSNLDTYLSNSNSIPQVTRNYSLFRNSQHNRRWQKIFRNLCPPEKTSGIRSFRQKVRPKSDKKTWSNINENELLNLGLKLNQKISWIELKRPFLYTVGFSAGTFACCAILQYENLLAQLRARNKRYIWGQKSSKAGTIRNDINKYWNNLSSGDKLFAPILAINLLVFAMWRIPSMKSFMYKYFTSNPQISNKGLPMLLSAFSHTSAVHLGCNMFALYSFMDPIVSTFGQEQVLGMYLSSAVITSFFSHLSKFATGHYASSLGASGAICTILGSFATLVPDARLQIIFLPFFSFTASMGIKCMMALDTAGILAGWRFFDHAAHLSGVLFGIWWCHWGSSLIWQKREPFMNWWHEQRKLILSTKEK